MDIQSFILGMGAMLVLAFAIGSIFAVVKVIKLGKNFREVQIWISQEFEKEKMIVGNQFQEVYRTIDSRFDKQYEKIMKEVIPKNRILQLMNNKTEEKISSDKE